MKIEIDSEKSIEKNAELFFEKSKKAKQKLSGLEKAITQIDRQISELEKKSLEKKTSLPLKKRKKQWFEQYHWFFTCDGFLVIGGRDAKQNEELVKKRMEKTDLYFHADIFGASHCILKTKDNSAPEQSMKEAAVFAAAFSRAWQSNASIVDVYSVLPEQVSKEAPSGEAIGKGAFMIYGERKWLRRTELSLAIGAEKTEEGYRIISCPESAVKKRALAFVLLRQGEDKKSDAAKKIKNILEKRLPEARLDLDEIVSMLPNGGIKLVLE